MNCMIPLQSFVISVPDSLHDVCSILNGKYEDIIKINNELCVFIIKGTNNHDSLEEIVYKEGISKTSQSKPNCIEYQSLLCTGIASLLYFVQCNWTGPCIDNDIDWLQAERHKALKSLSLHDECNINVQKPELLYLSKIIFSNIDLQLKFESCSWWLLRANLLHQQILEENSEIIFEETENLISKIKSFHILEDPLCQLLLNLEVSRFYLCFRRIQDSEHYLDQAQRIAGLTLTLQGAMGKRTKYQLEEKSQLYLKVTINKDIFPMMDCENLPTSATLDDELRLERIKFSEHIEETHLGAVEEAIILMK